MIVGKTKRPRNVDAARAAAILYGDWGTLALSGVEAIANATSVMKLNPGSSEEHANVSKTSTPAIACVMLEVCLLTALLGLGMHALGGLLVQDGDVNAPGKPGVRDFMLKYMAQVFVGGGLGPLAGHIAGLVVSFVIGFLLLSAVNTAIVDLIAISFLMSRDRELPAPFEKLNQFGVPSLGFIVATIIPAILVVAVQDMAGLADLYAVGVVGAIATNLGASSTDRTLALARWERGLMFCTFLVMAGIEISLFIDKPNARLFAATVLVFGLILRGLVTERAQKKQIAAANGRKPTETAVQFLPAISETSGPPVLCAVRGIGRTLDFGIQQAKETNRPLYLLFVREQPVLTPEDRKRKWIDDQEASDIFSYAKKMADGHTLLPCYAVSDAAAETIVDIAATVGASQLILGAPQRNMVVNLLRGNIIRNISSILPDEIDLLVYA